MTTPLTPLTGQDHASDGTGATPSSVPAGENALRDTPAGRKLMSAAQEFEAHLISAWWEEAEQDLDDRSGGALGSGLDGLKGLAMNSVATAMVKAGGIGLARTIFHSLEPALRRKLEAEPGSR
jgi:hypothetical protein